MKVWIVTQYREGDHYEILGVFSSEEKAKAACIEWEDGYGALDLDAIGPRERSEVWPYGFHYPLSEARKGDERS